MCLEDRPCPEPRAAGIDTGAREMCVAVPPDRDERPVRVFDTFTEDPRRMARCLKGAVSRQRPWNRPASAPAKSYPADVVQPKQPYQSQIN
jgi:hypothetical protein